MSVYRWICDLVANFGSRSPICLFSFESVTLTNYSNLVRYIFDMLQELWVQQHREYRVWQKIKKTEQTKKKQTRKPKPRKKQGKQNCGKCMFCFFFFFLVFFVSSGDSSCRFVFLVILFLFLFLFFAKIHFLCSTRGHNPRTFTHCYAVRYSIDV